MQAFERMFNNHRFLEEKTSVEKVIRIIGKAQGKLILEKKQIKEESLDLNLSYLCLAV